MIYYVIWYIPSIQAIFNTISFLQSLQIQFISSNGIIFRPIKLEFTMFASLLLLLTITYFNFVTF